MTIIEKAAHTPARGATFFGEPPALGFLAFTEAWERFSYYGMTALLVLYMTQALFMPAHIGHVAGFATFRAILESVFGRMSTVALASQINGLYTGFVYFTPVFGGWLADRFIGRRNAVVAGALSDERRPYRHGLRRVVPACASAVDRGLRAPQGQYLHTGRRALSRRRPRGPHARFLDLFHRH
jgi:MFS family permease